MGNIIENAVERIKGEGFTGAHSFIFLTRYAFLAGDRTLQKLIGNTLEELNTMPESSALIYAYAEYFEAAEQDFCRTAVNFLINRADPRDGLFPLALAKCARVFNQESWLEEAQKQLSEREKRHSAAPFEALAYLELYRATYNGAYLNCAAEIGEEVIRNFNEHYDHRNVYDLAEPSVNSAVAWLYDELARITQDEKWEKVRTAQNHFISLLADKYPTRVAFGLCALLGDEFESQTVICMLPGKEHTPELRALLSYYAPLTEVIVVPSAGTERAGYYLLKKGKLEPIASL